MFLFHIVFQGVLVKSLPFTTPPFEDASVNNSHSRCPKNQCIILLYCINPTHSACVTDSSEWDRGIPVFTSAQEMLTFSLKDIPRLFWCPD